MRSYQIIDWGAPLEPREHATPEPEGSQVLVRIDACGVCHSDLHIWDGFFDLGDGKRVSLADRGVQTPFTMGHEIVGEVIAVGPESEGLSIGDKRIVYPWIGCGKCEHCTDGNEPLCNAPRHLGTRVDGGYSDHVMVPDAKFLVDYEGIPQALACTYACSGLTAYSALRKVTPLKEGDDLMIIGSGGVGFNAINTAPALSPARVLVADVDATKRSAARQSGAAETIDNREPRAFKDVLKITEGGVAAAIDFVGSPSTFQFGMNVLRRGGTLVVVGLFGGAHSVSIPLFPFKLMTVCGSYVGTLNELRELIDLVKQGKVAPIPVETRPMGQVNHALNDLKAGRVMGRIVLNP